MVLLLIATITVYYFFNKEHTNIDNAFQEISYKRVPEEDFLKEDVLSDENRSDKNLKEYDKWITDLEKSNYQFTDFFKYKSKTQTDRYFYANNSLIGSWSQKNLTLFDDSGFRAVGSIYDSVNKELFVVSSPGHLYKIDESKSIKWLTRNEQKILLGEDFNGINLPDNSFRLLHQKSSGAMEFSDEEGKTWVDAK